MDILTLLIGIAAAVYGAQLLVDGGSAIAKRYDIPTIVIGSTIVAFGTSMPELAVNVSSALEGNTDLAMGNILGSNLFNICAIVGIVCLVAPMTVSDNAISKDLPMCLIAAMVVGICGNEIFFDNINYHQLFLSDGLVFLCFLALYMRYVYGEAGAGSSDHAVAQQAGNSSDAQDAPPHAMAKSIIFVVLGLIGLVAGGEFIVDGATGVAQSMGLSDRVIGLVIVGPGTSFPELMASIAAARRKDVGMVMGNVLGSNILNVFFTLGVTALILPIPLDLALNSVVIINIAVTALIMAFLIFKKDNTMGRGMGLFLVTLYIAYIVYSLLG
jgi:cation:H+ antiporter